MEESDNEDASDEDTIDDKSRGRSEPRKFSISLRASFYFLNHANAIFLRACSQHYGWF